MFSEIYKSVVDKNVPDEDLKASLISRAKQDKKPKAFPVYKLSAVAAAVIVVAVSIKAVPYFNGANDIETAPLVVSDDASYNEDMTEANDEALVTADPEATDKSAPSKSLAKQIVTPGPKTSDSAASKKVRTAAAMPKNNVADDDDKADSTGDKLFVSEDSATSGGSLAKEKSIADGATNKAVEAAGGAVKAETVADGEITPTGSAAKSEGEITPTGGAAKSEGEITPAGGGSSAADKDSASTGGGGGSSAFVKDSAPASGYPDISGKAPTGFSCRGEDSEYVFTKGDVQINVKMYDEAQSPRGRCRNIAGTEVWQSGDLYTFMYGTYFVKIVNQGATEEEIEALIDNIIN